MLNAKVIFAFQLHFVSAFSVQPSAFPVGVARGFQERTERLGGGGLLR
jgi:hypothetical protein